MAIFTACENRLIYRFDAEQLWIEPWGPDALRVRATKCDRMPERDWALLPQAPCPADIAIEEKGASITCGKLTCTLSRRGKLRFYNQKGELLLEEYVRNRVDVTDPKCSALEVEAREFKPILGGDYALTVRFESDPKERLYGMGQYQQPYLDLKGMDLELAQRNSQASVPFLLSSLGYGLLWHNPAVGRAVLGKNITSFSAASTDVMDYWICAGDTPAAIEEAYARATGTAPMMPEYAMGFWQCKLRYQTQQELLEVARAYKRRNLPISVIVVDFFHWPYQGEWKFDPTYWPDPDGMIAELKDMGIELMVSIWPTVDPRSENYAEMREKGYLIRTERGLRYGMDFMGDTIHFDATNPEARAYVWGKAKANYYDKGVRIFWLDEAEPEYTVYDFDLYRYHLGPNVKIGNIYPQHYAKTFYDGMRAAGQDNPINLLRCAWAGSQRYGALVWSGDIHSSFDSLRNQLAAGLNMGLAGIPWWTTDIGGFHGGDPTDPAFRELLVRWFQWGCFCPVMRLHGDREPKQPQVGESGGAACLSGADNEVWSFGEEAYPILTGYMALREALKPYIARQMAAAHERGTPVMRPLFYDYPDDAACWQVEDQYLFGPDILVAPVLFAGQRQRAVYLPRGARWRDTATGALYEGGQTVTLDAPLSRIPVLAREGFAFPEV